MQHSTHQRLSETYQPWLWFLTSLFFFRVIGQLCHQVFNLSIFESADIWASGTIPYPALLTIQTLIITGMVYTNITVALNRFNISERAANIIRGVSIIYGTMMLLRLFLGFTLLDGHDWFDKPLPTLSHLLLSQYLMTIGCHEKRPLLGGFRAYLFYPLTLLINVAYFFVFTQNSSISPFIVVNSLVALTMLSIFLLEHAEPFRKDWMPSTKEVVNDSYVLILIQLILPKMIAFGITLVVIAKGALHHEALLLFWHEIALPFKVMIMIILADFFRYWFHRWSHSNRALWKIHQYHHLPNKIYTVNVGRFHLLDKSIHVLLDTVPFIILGVDELTLSLYFLFYAINGLFQHSNLPLRFGVLNYFLSTAQLHRWHHAKKMSHAQSNYGNTTIIWDLMFNSYYNPKIDFGGDVGVSKAKLGQK